METNALKVMLWDDVAGYLTWDKSASVALFEYEPDFLTKNIDFAPLTMSVLSPRSQKGLPWMGEKGNLYQGLPPSIADSLPDKWGNSLFMAWLRDNKIKSRSVTPIDHLAFVGQRTMGALTYEPAHPLGSETIFSVDVQKLYHFAQQVLNQRETTVLSKENSILWQDLIKISSSPGGKRPKAIVAINTEENKIISGQGTIPKGFEHYILKYDDHSVYPFAKLEYVYYKMALDAGIEMMPSFLKSFGDVTHFLTKRFDRIGNTRLHIQTLAAMAPLCRDYEGIFEVIRKLQLPQRSWNQQYLRMVFNFLSGNVDDHAKNFAFCMKRNAQWELTPAYDLTFSIDLNAPSYMNKHELLLNGKNEGINRNDLEQAGQFNDITNYKQMIEQVSTAISQFERYAKEVDLPEDLIQQISKKLAQLSV